MTRSGKVRRLGLVLVLTLTGGAVGDEALAQDRPPPGHTRTLQVLRIAPAGLPAGVVHDPLAGLAYRADIAAPAIDGRLDDPAWAQAPVARDFWVADQDRPPSSRTEVRVLADDRNLYFGFMAFDSQPDAIEAIQTRRDAGLGFDDQVGVELDTYFNRRDVSRFSVSARGVQDDAIAGGRSAKIEWKGDWTAAAVRTEYGWSAEIAIPFAILNYQEGDTVFGVNFSRYQNRTQERSLWADVTPQNLPEEMGQLTGLDLPPAAAKQPWTIMPYALVGWNIPDKEGDIKNRLATVGVDLRYQPRPDLTGLVSLNPDFSQVERQITDINFSYVEKFRADVRPFFEEGNGYFGPTEFFYSNRVPDFDYGGKGFGRFGQTQFGAFASAAPNSRKDFAVRGLYEIDARNSLIGTVVGTDREDFTNTLFVGQFKGRQVSGLNYGLDGAITDTSGLVGQGSHVLGSLGWSTDYWGVGTRADRYSSNYLPANALLGTDLPGTQGANAFAFYSREQSDGWWRALRGDVAFNYRETTSDELQTRNWFASGSVEFHNQIRPGLAYYAGPYRPVTEIPGVFVPEANHDHYVTASLDFNTRSSRWAYGASYSWGALGGGDYDYAFGYAWWRPLDILYLSLTAEQLNNFGESDQIVFVGQWDVTPVDSLSTRYVTRDGFDSFRLAYGRRVRKGMDIFAVYNKEPFLETQFSVKLLLTYP